MTASEPREPAWKLQDLGLFLGAAVPCWLLASISAEWITNVTARQLAAQTLLELLLIGVLYLLALFRDRSFTEAVGWRFPFRGAWYCVLGGPLLAVVISGIAKLLRAPEIPSAIDQLQAGSIPLSVITVFAVVLGPLFEELVFRGFVQSVVGVAITSGIFALLHGAQNQWIWQYLVVMFLVGIVLGMARQWSGSTVASLSLHMGFNLTALLAAFSSQ